MNTKETLSEKRLNAAEAMLNILHNPSNILVIGNVLDAVPSPSNRANLNGVLHGLGTRMAYPAAEIANATDAHVHTYLGGPITPGEVRLLRKLNSSKNIHLLAAVNGELVDQSTRTDAMVSADFASTPSQEEILRLSRIHAEQIPSQGRAILPFIAVKSSEYFPSGESTVGPDASQIALKHVMAQKLREKQRDGQVTEKVVANGMVLNKEDVQNILDGKYNPAEVMALFEAYGDTLVLKGTDGVSGLSVGFLNRTNSTDIKDWSGVFQKLQKNKNEIGEREMLESFRILFQIVVSRMSRTFPSKLDEDINNLKDLLMKLLKEGDGIRPTEILVDEKVDIAVDEMGDRKFNVRSIIGEDGTVIPYAVFRQLEDGVKFAGEISALDPTSLGLTPEQYQKLMTTHTEWAKAAYELGYTGPLSTDILGATDGTYIGVDPNPRYGGSSVLAVVQEWFYKENPDKQDYILLDREFEMAHADGTLLTPNEICAVDEIMREMGAIPYATGLMKNGALKVIVPAKKEQVDAFQLATHEGLADYLNALVNNPTVQVR